MSMSSAVASSQAQELERNNKPNDLNQASEFSHTFGDLSESKKKTLLCNNGFLFGFLVDNNTGPIESTRQVARYKANEQDYSPAWIKEKNNVISEIIATQNDRQANYTHHGWSMSAISNLAPWVSSRIAASNQLNQERNWITKRSIAQRIAFHIPLRDLEPEPQFELDIRAAISKPTKLQKYQALYESLQLWGDVIPLIFDYGVSLHITDLENNESQSSSMPSSFEIKRVIDSRTARVNIKGGEPIITEATGGGSLSRSAVDAQQWSLVRVICAVSITSLLDKDLQAEINELFETLITYLPPFLPFSHGTESFDDTNHALKTISSIQAHAGSEIEDFTLFYRDGTSSGRHGELGRDEQIFCLCEGEHVTEVMLWTEGEWIHGLQFFTNTGRASPQYGGLLYGTPTILCSYGGVLAAFSGQLAKSDYWGRNMVRQLQTIWRHDVIQTPCAQRCDYIGSRKGISFNDRFVFKSSTFTRISSINIRCHTRIDSIQIIYECKIDSTITQSKGSPHGGLGGQERTFQLQPEERIITISGRFDTEGITQLCFVTNKGRTSDVFGTGENSTAFSCQALCHDEEHPMSLRYIAGRSDTYVGGILFVWASHLSKKW